MDIPFQGEPALLTGVREEQFGQSADGKGEDGLPKFPADHYQEKNCSEGRAQDSQLECAIDG